MALFRTIFGWNYVLCVALTGWLVAQVLKTIINAIIMREFDWERMWGAGGMPSAHSATVCSMVIATGKYSGVHSAMFAIAFVFAIIVMYDAMGVRRETGEQAKILNRLLNDWIDMGLKNTPWYGDKKLKEMVGHTPIQVVTGALLGVLIGWLIPLV